MQNVMQALYLTRNARGLPASARRYNTNVLTVKPDENSGVKWFTPEGAVEASSEKWFREHIYNKLNEKMRQFHAEKK